MGGACAGSRQYRRPQLHRSLRLAVAEQIRAQLLASSNGDGVSKIIRERRVSGGQLRICSTVVVSVVLLVPGLSSSPSQSSLTASAVAVWRPGGTRSSLLDLAVFCCAWRSFSSSGPHQNVLLMENLSLGAEAAGHVTTGHMLQPRHATSQH